MKYEFQYIGGSAKPDQHQLEKFMLFFVIGGHEYPIYQLLKNGEVKKQVDPTNLYPTYLTNHQVCKLFCSFSGFGLQKTFYSFYMLLLDGPADTVTIHPFSKVYHGRPRTEFMFRAKVTFVSNKEAVGLLDPEAESAKFLRKQGMLPLDTLKQMITVEKTKRQGVRQVRVKQKQKNGG